MIENKNLMRVVEKISPRPASYHQRRGIGYVSVNGAQITERIVTRNGTTYKQDTSNIGAPHPAVIRDVIGVNRELERVMDTHSDKWRVDHITESAARIKPVAWRISGEGLLACKSLTCKG